MLLDYISKKFMGFTLSDEHVSAILDVVDNDGGGVITFSEFFAFMIMIKRLTPKITDLYYRERAALRVQGVARVYIAVKRFKLRMRQSMAMRRGDQLGEYTKI